MCHVQISLSMQVILREIFIILIILCIKTFSGHTWLLSQNQPQKHILLVVRCRFTLGPRGRYELGSGAELNHNKQSSEKHHV